MIKAHLFSSAFIIFSILFVLGCCDASKEPLSSKVLQFNETAYNLGLALRWQDDGDERIEEKELLGLETISPKAKFEEGEPNSFLQKLLDKIDWTTMNLDRIALLLHDTSFLDQRLAKLKLAYQEQPTPKNRQAYRRVLRNRELATRRLQIMDLDFSILPKPDQRAIKILIDEVVPYVEEIYLAQIDPRNLTYREEIIEKGDPEDLFALHHLGGVQCLTAEIDPLCSAHPESPKPTPNQGFWPEDHDKRGHDLLLQGSAPNLEILKSPFVVRHRLPTGIWNWESINNHPPLKPSQTRLVAGLKKAAQVPGIDPSFSHFLMTRARELENLTNPYPFFEGDISWIQLNGPWDMTLGYYEEYHSPFHLNAIMEAFIGIVDEEWEKKGQQFRELLYWMEDEIAKDLGPQYQKRDFKTLPPFKFIQGLSAGDGRAKFVTLAYYLPNVKPYGRADFSKKVLLTNKMLARYDAVARPMAERTMDPAQVARLNPGDISLFVIGHENAHGAGPSRSYVVKTDGEKKMTSHELLGKHSSALEEARADMLGLASLPEAVRREIMTQEQADNAAIGLLALLTRGVAMGEEDDHGKSAILTFYALYKNGGILLTPEGRFAANLENGKIFEVCDKIGKKLNKIQMTGNFRDYDQWYREAQRNLPKKMKEEYLPALRQMPKDFFPYYRFQFSPNL